MIVLPDWIDPEAWAGFCEMRRSMRKVPFTERAARMVIRDLEVIRARGHCPNAALDQSTLLGWRGVWPAKEKQIEAAPKSRADETRDYLASQRMTEAERVAADEARRAVMAKIRRVA